MNICIECGLCCDGTIFSFVPIEPEDDVGPLREVGAILETDETARFLQPCAALELRCCSIYESRPSLCRAYRCALLKRVEAGEAEVEEARDIIATVIELRDRVRPTIEAMVNPRKQEAMVTLYSLMRAKLSEGADETPAADRAALLLDIAALRVLLASQFDPVGTLQQKPRTRSPEVDA